MQGDERERDTLSALKGTQGGKGDRRQRGSGGELERDIVREKVEEKVRQEVTRFNLWREGRRDREEVGKKGGRRIARW